MQWAHGWNQENKDRLPQDSHHFNSLSLSLGMEFGTRTKIGGKGKEEQDIELTATWMLTSNTQQIHAFSSQKQIIIIVWHGWVVGSSCSLWVQEYIKNVSFHSRAKALREGIHKAIQYADNFITSAWKLPWLFGSLGYALIMSMSSTSEHNIPAKRTIKVTLWALQQQF